MKTHPPTKTIKKARTNLRTNIIDKYIIAIVFDLSISKYIEEYLSIKVCSFKCLKFFIKNK